MNALDKAWEEINALGGSDDSEDLIGNGCTQLGKQEDNRQCSCYPDDNPPVPCARKHALRECRITHLLSDLEAMALNFDKGWRAEPQIGRAHV